MGLTEINVREKDFHNKLHSSGDPRAQNKYYKALHNLYEDFLIFLKNNAQNKNVLDFGCGSGGYAEKVVNFNPSKLTAIDISEKAIKIAKSKGYNKIDFKVENCESTNLDSNSFDVIYGVGILHHLNLKKTVKEIERLLRKDGSLFFIEPLGTNPIINLYRKFTPNARSDDEHPLTFSDIRYFESLLDRVKIHYYGFLTLIFLPLYKSPKNSKIFSFLSKIDKILFTIPFFKFLAWSVLIEAKKN
tara:strand:+ start:108 stop:842 length:735 start_codon:yes stop_codon:yes gene_type:complete